MVDFNLVGFWRTMVHLLALVQKSHRRNPTTMLSKAQAFQESIAHLENEIVEQNQGSGDDASDEDYDNYKFMSVDCEHRFLSGHGKQEVVSRKECRFEEGARVASNIFYERLESTKWMCFTPTPCQANEQVVHEFYENLKWVDFNNPQLKIRGRLVWFWAEKINTLYVLENHSLELMRAKDTCLDDWLISQVCPHAQRFPGQRKRMGCNRRILW